MSGLGLKVYRVEALRFTVGVSSFGSSHLQVAWSCEALRSTVKVGLKVRLRVEDLGFRV